MKLKGKIGTRMAKALANAINPITMGQLIQKIAISYSVKRPHRVYKVDITFVKDYKKYLTWKQIRLVAQGLRARAQRGHYITSLLTYIDDFIQKNTMAKLDKVVTTRESAANSFNAHELDDSDVDVNMTDAVEEDEPSFSDDADEAKNNADFEADEASEAPEEPVDIDMNDEAPGKAKKKKPATTVKIKKVTVTSSKWRESSRSWQFTLQTYLMDKKLPNLAGLVKYTAENFNAKGIRNVTRAIVVQPSKTDETQQVTVQTEGSNLSAILALSEKYGVDTTNIYTNDIRKIHEYYGIEAARKVLTEEVTNVYGHYGIEVSPRHLSLLGDYMTFPGELVPLSRHGITHRSSPTARATFEQASKFFAHASFHGEHDDMNHPSSSIMFGADTAIGTGCFEVRQNLRSVMELDYSI